MVCRHSIVAFLPVHRANFAVLFEVLERIDHAETLVDGAAKWHVIDNLVADCARFVDEEEATVGYEFTFDFDVVVIVEDDFTCENIIIFRNCFVDISDEWVGYAFDTTFVLRGIKPSPVGKLRVSRATYYLDTTCFKLCDFVLEAVKLSWAYECEIFWVKEKDDVLLTNELVERELFDDVLALDCFSFEGWCFSTYEY